MRDPAQEFEQRFQWRKKRWLHNLNELAAHAQEGGSEATKRLPGLHGQLASDQPADALRWSILMLWLEATECYILGQFQSSVLTTGAVLERTLKLEYCVVRGSLPKGAWPLGRCIYELDWSGTRLTDPLLGEAKECISPRNSRAHALLEHDDPQLSIIGGPSRGVEILSNHHYLIEPYRGDSLVMLSHVWRILESLYGSPPTATTGAAYQLAEADSAGERKRKGAWPAVFPYNEGASPKPASGLARGRSAA
jgi:hypothetical protein